ncbi:MAG: hypothetical protein N3E36_03225 [Sulfolobales archaeon]|nr:hypothetical protein [Sulfolobales archaeon]
MSTDADNEGKLSVLANNLNTFKELRLVADSSTLDTLSVIKDICEATGFMCYNPLDAVDVNVSLAWAETLQYLDSPIACIKNIDCFNELIESFVKTVKIAIESSYIYSIDLVKLGKVFVELKAVIKT